MVNISKFGFMKNSSPADLLVGLTHHCATILNNQEEIILTALDLEDRLGHSSNEPRPSSRCIVFKTANDLARLPQPPENHEMADSDPTGLLVDAIGDILPPDTRVLPAPPEALSGLDTRFIAGVISSGESLITVLQIGNLVSISEPKKNAA
jgi:chemotaxis signal transduction protein